jgi:hypothetical protein
MTSAPDTAAAEAAAGRTEKPSRRPQAGPPLLVPVLAYAVLTVAAVAVNASTPRPDASGSAVLAYDLAHGTPISVGAFLLFGSAVPLALTAAVVYRRLRALGITAPGSAISLVGGVLAAAALSLSGMFAWAGGRLADGADPSLARALADLSFLSGGPAYAVALGLLIAGLSVTSLFTGLLARPAGWIGLVIAAAGAVSTLTLVGSGFSYLIPVVRFGGTAWLIYAAAVLPHTRRPANRRS